MTELSDILAELSNVLRNPSTAGDEEIRRLLKKHVKHYGHPE
jgi:hypothetical protein